MSKERELLTKAVEWMHELKYVLLEERDCGDTVLLDLIADLNKIEKFLAQPEQTEQTEQKPLSEQEIIKGNPSMLNATREIFIKGVRFAEDMHGIGGGE